MKSAFVAVVAMTWAFASAAVADPLSVTVPIEPAPMPIVPAPSADSPMFAPAQPNAHALSQINPTAGPAVPRKAALKQAPSPSTHRALLMPIADQRRETAALNRLAAAGYGEFHDVHRVGRNYQATVDDPHGSYLVTIDPDSDRITPGSAAADRETRALNLLAGRGYVQVKSIRPSDTGFAATVMQNGEPLDVAIDPENGRIVRGD